MNKIPLVSLVLVCGLVAPAWGQQNLKIGYIDIQEALSRSHAGKRAVEGFQTEVKKIEAELLREKEELEQLKDNIDKKGLLLREEERRNMEKEFQRRYRDYQRSMRDHEQELRLKENEVKAKILSELQEVTAGLAKAENYTLILSRDLILYGDSSTDITDRVVELYNQRFTNAAAKAE